MVEIVLKVIDQLMQLLNRRKESDHKLYEEFVTPALANLEVAHNNYLSTFHEYRKQIQTLETPLTARHPVIAKIQEDSLYFSQLRSHLRSLQELRTDSVFGPFVESIINYLQCGEMGKQALLKGYSTPLNAPRRIAIEQLTRVFSGSGSETDKRECALRALDLIVGQLQMAYDAVGFQNMRLKTRLLDPRLGKKKTYAAVEK